MQDSSLTIKELNLNDTASFWAMLDNFKFYVDRDYYEGCIERHKEGNLIIVTASKDDAFVGFCLLNWHPKYGLFKKFSMPETQDLNVLGKYRRSGVGRALIEYCEETARKKGYEDIGIGVGLNSSYGAAQRLYVRLGYVPDGNGVCYDRKQVAGGDLRPIDDNLSLMMTKIL